MFRSWTLALILLVVLSLGAGIAWRYRGGIAIAPQTSEQPATSTSPEAKLAHGSCLEEDEMAEYPVDEERYGKGTTLPKIPLVEISVKDKASGRVTFVFQIENVSSVYHAIELHRCGIYVIRRFNYNPELSERGTGLPVELWRYRYDGKEEKLLTFATNAALNYDYDFRVDDTETHLQLITGILGNPDYALLFRNLKTGKDDFILKLDDLLKQNPGGRPGSFDFADFNADRTYLWGDLYDGPFETVYFRIAFPSWRVEVFPPPPNIPSGAERAPYLKTGWIAYADITTFTGIQEVTEQIWEQARREGRQKNLWLYNIFTEEQIRVASADPAWRFNINWLSDTELEYTLPSGEKKIYTIQKQI